MKILFDSAEYIAFDKPDGLASIRERNKEEDCLLIQAEMIAGQKLFVVHRLDKEVSGVIVFARNADSHRWLNDQFASRKTRKLYYAIVLGKLESHSGSIEKPIRQFGSGRMGIDVERGKSSRTDYEVISAEAGSSVLKVTPITGRRHQIRVHFYSIGHPIAGDLRYGDRKIQSEWPRLMLHASELSFRISGEDWITIKSPLPESMSRFIDRPFE